MLLGCGCLWKFVMFYLLLFYQKAENNGLKKKLVGKSFVISSFCFFLKIGTVGPIDQKINLDSPHYFLKIVDFNCKFLQKQR